jgi:hypothetical protein
VIRSWFRMKASPFRFEWDPRSARFRNLRTGRYVSLKDVRRAIEVVLDASPVEGWAESVADGSMSVGAWHQGMRDEIKRNYLQMYLAGRGGTGMMTARDYGSVGGMIREQYRYLDAFAQEIAAGNLSAGQIAMRSAMYINSAREAFERAYKRAAEDAGKNLVRWVWEPEAEHCEDCEALNGLGWRPAVPWPFKVNGEDALPGAGATACLTNCRCHLQWKKGRQDVAR